jgi:sporulation protein YlmC with PRC-barrel domain
MNLYAIRRRNAWESAEELEKVGARSKEVGETEFSEDLAWIRTYVLKDEDGTLGSICIYEAKDVDTVRDHAKRVGMPADEVTEVADTVIVRPDPQPQAA